MTVLPDTLPADAAHQAVEHQAPPKTESTERTVVERVSEAKNWCDAYRQTFPNLYFFQFGSEFYLKDAGTTDATTDHISRTRADLDLRCVHTGKIKRRQREFIFNALKRILHPTPIELFFTPLNEFSQGKVGASGGFTVVESMLYKKDGALGGARLRQSGLVALYSNSTLRPFSGEPVPSTIGFADEQFHLPTRDEVLQAADLKRADAEEWVHLNLKNALVDYYTQPRQSLKNMGEYVQRLAKHLIRVAFGVAVAQLNPAELKNYATRYSQLLVLNPERADTVHASEAQALLRQHPVAVQSQTLEHILTVAELVRNYGRDMIGNNAAEYAHQPLSTWAAQMERVLMALVLQVGASDRRDHYHATDFMLELVVHSELSHLSGVSLEHWHDGDVLLEAGSQKSAELEVENTQEPDLLFIPRLNRAGQPNGKSQVIRDGQSFENTDMLVGALRMLFPDIPTASQVVAAGDVEGARIDRSVVLGWLKSPRLRALLSRPESMLSELQSQTLLLHALLTHLSYRSLYFVRDMAQFGRAEADATEDFETQDASTQALHEKNPLELYFVPRFADVVQALCQRSGAGEDQGVRTLSHDDLAEESHVLFTRGEQSRQSKLYVVLSGSVVLKDFAAHDHAITLSKHAVFGEAGLLREHTRTATAVLQPNSQVLEIPTKVFESLTASFQYDPQLKSSPRLLLYHLAAVNCLRVLRNSA